MIIFSVIKNIKQNRFFRLLRLDVSLCPMVMILGTSIGGIIVSCMSFDDIVSNFSIFPPILVGSFLLRSFGCIVNDILDKDIDLLSERTRKRPIASGEISVFTAAFAAIIILGLSFFIWLVYCNYIVKIVSFFVLLLLIFYPLGKRYTFTPEIILGIIMSSPSIISSLQILGYFDYSAMIFFCGCIYWNISNSTIYGIQDYKNDIKNGVLSSVVLCGDKIYAKIFLDIFISFLIFLFMGYAMNYTLLYYAGMFLSFAAILMSMYKLDLNNPNTSHFSFKISCLFPIMASISIALSKFID